MKTLIYSIPAAAALLLLLLLGSCAHKDLVYGHTYQSDVEVVFDWRDAPDAAPASMATYFFDYEDDTSLRFIFDNKDGGNIRIPASSYCALAMNSDNGDWARIRATDDRDSFETYTQDADNLAAYSLSTRAIPRAPGTEQERVAKTPGMLWSHRLDNIGVKGAADKDTHTVIIFYPKEAVCHYTVDIYDVENLQHLDGSQVDATISGMAEGYLHGKECGSEGHVTMPFVLDADRQADTLHSEFLTFGESAQDTGTHILTVYLYLTDGSKWYYTFDVTSQVSGAPDPRHVHIVLKGLPLPTPITTGSGVVPTVNDWQTEDIVLQF